MPIEIFHLLIVGAIHTHSLSRVPDLLREVDPFTTIMQAVIKLHKSNKIAFTILNDVGASETLSNALNLTFQLNAHVFGLAIKDPSNVALQGRVADAICMGLADIRAMFIQTTPHGVITKEAKDLLNEINQAPMAHGEIAYIRFVDSRWSDMRQLWGGRLTATLCTEGALTQLLPIFVSRLNALNKDRALGFWDDHFRGLKDGNLRSQAPPELIKRFDASMRLRAAISPSTPAWNEHVHFEMEQVPRPERYDRYGSVAATVSRTVRLLHVPADLHWVAPSGLIMSHWRSFQQCIAGHHTRQFLNYDPHKINQIDGGDSDDDPKAAGAEPLSERT